MVKAFADKKKWLRNRNNSNGCGHDIILLLFVYFCCVLCCLRKIRSPQASHRRHRRDGCMEAKGDDEHNDTSQMTPVKKKPSFC